MNISKTVALTLLAASLAACASKKDNLPKLDYQSDNKKIVQLDVPPDLTDPNQGNRFSAPGSTLINGAVRASDMNKKAGKTQNNANAQVLTQVPNIHLQRDGSIRWLTIDNKQAAELWPLLRAFWQEQGFTIEREEPSIGLMQTNWAENRAKLPSDVIRGIFEKVGLGGVYSSGERDMFTIRLERNSKGGTDVFFSQKGMKEVYTSKDGDSTAWQPRPNEPELEAAFLARFMQYLGADAKQVQQQIAAQKQNPNEYNLAKIDGNSIYLLGPQERNWRRVALALDRVGLNVIGENQSQYAYLVEVAAAEASSVSNKKPGLFGRMFGRSKKAEQQQQPKQQPRLMVLAIPLKDGGTRVTLANEDGTIYTGKDATKWLQQLDQQLR
ncbi:MULTISPECIES: outer membrane protein assembly factor BamC [Snodgrassella]|uniref:outer membrane protein assembly factor BamC n=1 Tax=Snodgrassella TaxID=1193515 RepID=UPI000996DEB7|nr:MULTISPECIES: outer membrane protein assembly factor BamC [Snodgrassella]MBI0096724.1 outer membrane protein assembly factor BamC [Snodgrassella sp. W8134]MBI0101542.1 outer membrane protein assembly factor BamC [Snodgrassella sp. W8135]MBI0129671.1 outer membrane protein assembly factor BamC [Snodgrassella sp. W8124]MBI0133139.1 outer membrane protein assembly factor BamC [Snodgrassella sp. W8132]NUE80414.1 outer membrane protein assembly factor BamC [Snodgrassella sp. ESL0304]